MPPSTLLIAYSYSRFSPNVTSYSKSGFPILVRKRSASATVASASALTDIVEKSAIASMSGTRRPLTKQNPSSPNMQIPLARTAPRNFMRSMPDISSVEPLEWTTISADRAISDTSPTEPFNLDCSGDGHEFHPGSVEHRVQFVGSSLFYDVIGTGTGQNPNFNNWFGIATFLGSVQTVVNEFRR